MFCPDRTRSFPPVSRTDHSGWTSRGLDERLSVVLSTSTSTSRLSTATIPAVDIFGSALLRQLRGLGAHARFLLAQLRRELRAEVLALEDLADLDLGLGAGHRVGATLDPLDGLFLRLHLPQPVAGDQLFGLGEWAVDDGAPVAREPHARALAAWLQPFTAEEDAGVDQVLVVLAHRRQQLLARQLAGFRVLARLHNDHESHVRPSVGSTVHFLVERAGLKSTGSLTED